MPRHRCDSLPRSLGSSGADDEEQRLDRSSNDLSMMGRRVDPGRGLSAKILGLAVIFLLIGEVLIFLPSIARYRLTYLEEMVAMGRLAILAANAATERGTPIGAELERSLLASVGAITVTLGHDGAEVMLGEVAEVDRVYDLRGRNPVVLMLDVMETLVAPEGRVVRVLEPWKAEQDDVVSVVFNERSMRQALLAYGYRILFLSLLLSVILASLLFLVLRRMIVQPLSAITERLAEFRTRPEHPIMGVPRGDRKDEIGFVEWELHAMQKELQQALKEKTRLAALGAAVSWLSHDLRNILASAVLLSDRLETSADPSVRALAPRLVNTLERAIRLCVETLQFARQQPTEPRLAPFTLRPLVAEAAALSTKRDSSMLVRNEVLPDLVVVADRDQIFRVLTNLTRNAQEALGGRAGELVWEAAVLRDTVEIIARDNGPGIAPAIRPRLFQTFSGTTKDEGTGLGLAICREIMRAHGGDIELASTGAEGTSFRLILPAR